MARVHTTASASAAGGPDAGSPSPPPARGAGRPRFDGAGARRLGALLTLALGCGDLSPDLVVGRVRTDAGAVPIPDPRPDLGFERDAGGPLAPDASVRPPRVDLALAGFDPPPDSAAPGTRFTLVVSVENLGVDPAPTSLVRVRLFPTGPLEDRTPIEVGVAEVPALVAGDVREAEPDVRIPSLIAPGRYRVRLELDPLGTLAETDEANNAADAGPVDVGPLRVSPLDLDFGEVGPGCAVREVVTLEQVGPGRAVLSEARIEPGERPFTLEDPALPLPVRAGEAAHLGVRFAPSAVGPTSAELRLRHDQFFGPQTIRLRGEGVDRPSRRDRRRQYPGPRLDLVWVIQSRCARTRCELEDEQRQLAGDGFGALLRFLAAEQAQWRLMVTTAESSPLGRLRGAPTSTSTPDLLAEVHRQVEAGAAASGPSRFFDAALAVLDSGAIRPETGVIVTFLGVDDDQSDQDPSAFVRAARARVGSRRLHLGAILPPSPEGCPDRAPATPRLASAVNEVGGTLSSACDIDDFATLFDLGDRELGLAHAFPLRRLPEDPLDLSVQVDGRFVSALEPSTGRTRWHYDPQRNAVVFEPLFVPEPGALVTLRYRSRC